MTEQTSNFPSAPQGGLFVGGPAPTENAAPAAVAVAAPVPASIQEKRTKIFQVKVKEEKIKIDEWDLEVLIRGLTGGQRAKFLQLTMTSNGGVVPMDKVYSELVIMCVFDPDTGAPMFRPTDKDAILLQPGGILDRLVIKAMELSGLTNESMATLRKN
jgi:hypothetical protein